MALIKPGKRPSISPVVVTLVAGIAIWAAWHFIIGPGIKLGVGVHNALAWKDPHAPPSVSDHMVVNAGDSAPCAGTLDAETLLENDILLGGQSSANATNILRIMVDSGGFLLVPGEQLSVVGVGDGNAYHVKIVSAIQHGKTCWLDGDILVKIATRIPSSD